MIFILLMTIILEFSFLLQIDIINHIYLKKSVSQTMLFCVNILFIFKFPLITCAYNTFKIYPQI